MEGLASNRERVLGRIAAAARAAGREPASVALVCVTKTVEPEVAAELYALGARDLGENRVDELERKHAHFRSLGLAPRWHYLGHVQRNKARRVVRIADVIHSVDSGRLLDALARLAREEGRRPAVYLQVKLTDEATKTGVAADEVGALIERARAAGTLPLLGLMAMAPLGAPEQAAATFRALAELAHGLPEDAFEGGAPGLSMGMSDDLEAAIGCGATVVRIGSALFAAAPQRAAGD